MPLDSILITACLEERTVTHLKFSAVRMKQLGFANLRCASRPHGTEELVTRYEPVSKMHVDVSDETEQVPGRS